MSFLQNTFILISCYLSIKPYLYHLKNRKMTCMKYSSGSYVVPNCGQSWKQGGANKKEIQLNFRKLFSILLFKTLNRIHSKWRKMWTRITLNTDNFHAVFTSLCNVSKLRMPLRKRTLAAEAVARMCSVKKVFLEISQNSQESNCTILSFLIKLQA